MALLVKTECFWQVTQCRLQNREDSEASSACLSLSKHR